MKGYRTIAFNVIMSIVAVLAIVAPDAEVPTADAVNAGIDAVETAVVAVWSVGNMLLRAITNSPMFKKEPPE